MKTERLRRKKLIFRDPFSLFPAQAGVILSEPICYFVGFAFPRASGGDPNVMKSIKRYLGFSPRKRG